jgi:hypothetical protein
MTGVPRLAGGCAGHRVLMPGRDPRFRSLIARGLSLGSSGSFSCLARPRRATRAAHRRTEPTAQPLLVFRRFCPGTPRFSPSLPKSGDTRQPADQPGLHIMAVVQLRHPTEGRAYHDRKVAAGKTPREAMRCLKWRLSDVVYHQMVLDDRTRAAGPGGHVGAATGSSAAGSHPAAGTSEKSLPGAATSDPTPTGRPVPWPFPRPVLLPDRSRRQAPSCLTAARTGTPFQWRKRPLDTEGSHEWA